ncbi:MAG: sulfatase-like hydrolase/transferase [Planctomycetota bacterium]|nr:sulfatase-like hydrolase/transferase [Planctomycetota bacterium]
MPDAPPNILLITSDQQHWDTLGVANPRIQTPALDRLAREGTRFTRAYCNSPVCSPSRSTIITGLYPSSHHCWTIGVKLPEDVPTLGQALGGHGYDTTLVGKAHFQPLASRPGSESIECQPILRDLDFWRKFHGPWYGFDHVETARMHGDESHVGQHYAIWLEEHGLKDWADYFVPLPGQTNGHKTTRTWALPPELHYTTWTAERTIANIERSAGAGRPFFLWSSFHDPHPPYTVPEPWASMYRPEEMRPGRLVPGEFDRMPPHFGMTQRRDSDWSVYREEGGHTCHGFHSHLHDEAELRRNMAVYYGMTSFMDQQIGRILGRLDALGLADNTLVVFSTDHGHFLGQHGLVAKGAFHYEDLLRVPFLVRWPGRVPAGQSSEALQSLIDLAPTFLSAAGAPTPGLMQGVSQLDVWRGREATARDHVLVENRHQPTTVHLRTYIDRQYKMTVYRGRPYGELFDLERDPNELRNLWDDPAHAAVKAETLRRFVDAELRREPTRMPRIAGA